METKKIVLAGMFAAMTIVGAFIRIPIGSVPFTLQIFFVIFAGVLLGSKLGFLSQLVYMIIGLAGLPVFSQGGGLSYIFNPTFGYIIGFCVAAFVSGFISERLLIKKISFMRFFISSFIGLVSCYIIAVPYMYLIFNFVAGEARALLPLIIGGFIVFLPLDLVKIIFVSMLSVKIYPVVRG